jgi:hypothetical protein
MFLDSNLSLAMNRLRSNHNENNHGGGPAGSCDHPVLYGMQHVSFDRRKNKTIHRSDERESLSCGP